MKTVSALIIFGVTLVFCPAISLANAIQANVTQADVTKAIDSFVATLYPKGSTYFWVINDAASETLDEVIVDINATVRIDNEQPPIENRFLLLIVKGKLLAAHNIPLEAEVDCKQEQQI